MWAGMILNGSQVIEGRKVTRFLALHAKNQKSQL